MIINLPHKFYVVNLFKLYQVALHHGKQSCPSSLGNGWGRRTGEPRLPGSSRIRSPISIFKWGAVHLIVLCTVGFSTVNQYTNVVLFYTPVRTLNKILLFLLLVLLSTNLVYCTWGHVQKCVVFLVYTLILSFFIYFSCKRVYDDFALGTHE